MAGRGTCRYPRRRSADRNRAVTPENQIMDLLTHRRRRLFCEECIVRAVRLTDLSKVRTMIDAIGAAKGFRRATGPCHGCGQEREGIIAG
jgi:hypothetical protein